jgi:hypothetical protein
VKRSIVLRSTKTKGEVRRDDGKRNIFGARRVDVTCAGSWEPRVEGLALPKSVASGNLSLNKAVIRSSRTRSALITWVELMRQKDREGCMDARYLDKLVSPVIAGLVLSTIGLASLPAGAAPALTDAGLDRPIFKRLPEVQWAKMLLSWARLHRKWRSCTRTRKRTRLNC